MENNIKKYNSIDMMRLLCAIMVVAIHTQPLSEFKNEAGYFATFIFPRLGVPFFFAVSGYFYISSLLSEKKVFLKYTKRLLSTYIIWSSIYYLIDFVQTLRKHASIPAFVKKSFFNFFLSGSHYQLWFFPTLIFCIIIVTLFRKHLGIVGIIAMLFYIVGCLVGAYSRIGTEIPVINSLFHSTYLGLIRHNLMTGLPFFMLGYYLNILRPSFNKLKRSTVIILFSTSLALFLIEIYIVKYLNLQTNTILTVFLYPLLALTMILCFRNPLTDLNLQAKFFKLSANFMYYAHPLYMFILTRLALRLFNIHLRSTPMFLLICLTTILSSFIIYKLDNRVLNKLVI